MTSTQPYEAYYRVADDERGCSCENCRTRDVGVEYTGRSLDSVLRKMERDYGDALTLTTVNDRPSADGHRVVGVVDSPAFHRGCWYVIDYTPGGAA